MHFSYFWLKIFKLFFWRIWLKIRNNRGIRQNLNILFNPQHLIYYFLRQIFLKCCHLARLTDYSVLLIFGFFELKIAHLFPFTHSLRRHDAIQTFERTLKYLTLYLLYLFLLTKQTYTWWGIAKYHPCVVMVILKPLINWGVNFIRVIVADWVIRWGWVNRW